MEDLNAVWRRADAPAEVIPDLDDGYWEVGIKSSFEALIKLGLCTNKQASEKLRKAKAGRTSKETTEETSQEIAPESKPNRKANKEFTGAQICYYLHGLVLRNNLYSCQGKMLNLLNSTDFWETFN